MEVLNFKKCLDGKWKLYIEENKNCKEYASYISCERALKNREILCIDGSVPGNFELDLQKAGLCKDLFYDTDTLSAQKLENRHLWYVTQFDFNGDTSEDYYFLFEGVDTVSEYYLNGELIGLSENMLISHKINATNLNTGKNELMVHIIPATIAARGYKFEAGCTSIQNYNAASLNIRKAASMFGWDIMPRIVSGGIWKSVYLCLDKKERINDVYLYNRDRRPEILNVYIDTEIQGDFAKDYTVVVDGVCKDSHFHAERQLWHNEDLFNIKIENPLLWWPKNLGEQNLYAVTVTLKKGDKILDTKSRKIGLRAVRLEYTDYIDDEGNGEFKFTVNGENFFCFGTNWVPLDAFHSRDKLRLKKALELLDESGCNMVRCWGGNVYEDEEFYDFCDEHGIAIWQDFAMGCAVYPQDERFKELLKTEAEAVVKKYRQHPSLFLWAGDNEYDVFVMYHRNPNKNSLTRKVLPDVIERLDPCRDYLPSSPYVSEKAYKDKKIFRIPEDHLWGPRDYYKQNYYKNAVCRFASETGYHGCNSPESIKKFIRPENLWPYQDNDAWVVHSASMETKKDAPYAYRIPLMASHLKVLFGDTVPDTLEDFALASQISQSEAVKYFIERFRGGKWERTGILWWNLIDGWPQFSDSVVDYYYCKKLAFSTIKRCQTPVCLMIREDEESGTLRLIAANDTLEEVSVSYKVWDAKSGKVLLENKKGISKNSNSLFEEIPYIEDKTILIINYTIDGKEYINHYLCGEPTYDFGEIKALMKKVGILNIEGF